MYTVFVAQRMHLSIREIYASRDASYRLTNHYGRGQGGGIGGEGAGIGLIVSTDRIINEIRRAGLETSLTLSQCNIALESILTIIVINIIIINVDRVRRRGMILIGANVTM